MVDESLDDVRDRSLPSYSLTAYGQADWQTSNRSICLLPEALWTLLCALAPTSVHGASLLGPVVLLLLHAQPSRLGNSRLAFV